MRRIAILCAVLPACSFEHGLAAGVDDAHTNVDVRPIDSALGAWSTPAEIPGLSSGFGDDDPSLTDDLLEIYWGSRRGGGAEDIWMASRVSATAPWGTPTAVTALNSIYSETTAKVTGDGLAIFFTSTRDPSNGNDPDVYYSIRGNRSAAWSLPSKVTQLSADNYGDYAPFVSTNLHHVIMCAGDITADEALWTSDRTSDAAPWGPRALVAELDEPNISECDPVEANAFALYYSSQRLSIDVPKRYDIYRAERSSVGVPWGNRTPVTELNSTANDRDPWVSPDERTVVFSTDRDGIDRLYMATR